MKKFIVVCSCQQEVEDKFIEFEKSRRKIMTNRNAEKYEIVLDNEHYKFISIDSLSSKIMINGWHITSLTKLTHPTELVKLTIEKLKGAYLMNV